ncbi:MAG TPA: cytochrome c maturation protein CcmE [Candidatus Sulfotelmatobacter sp.]|nr:cytochrome c maturation protein CcmE [Candidatus Sulfotelmatobacter sp.]
MKGRIKYVVAGAVVLGALGFLILGGFREAVVYFVTPSELSARGASVPGALRLGGMVQRGSVHWDPKTLALSFAVTDGKATIAVRHTGAPPDLFGEGRGAVVEGQYADGVFQAKQILAKHSEDYHPPAKDATAAQKQDLYKTLEQQKGTAR